ncbi:MAG: UTP--glucose-1-phosphate uridylyltransferase [Fibromonadaceae bacterium]|nr:UTP--glucose-1-phosphate uridylyltransferase [Fibromonadaceae bacterium]
MQISIASLMESSGVVFGTSGARGLVSDMTDEVCYAYTLGFLQHTLANKNAKKKVAIGGDLRPSTPRIMAACMVAAKTAGFECDYQGFLPSPALALYSIKKGIPSIMVTGSHIPDNRNGIKFCDYYGEITKADEQDIRSQEVDMSSWDKGQGTKDMKDSNGEALKIYKEYILNLFPKNSLQGVNIAFYQHSAVGRDIAPEILTELGANVKAVGRSEKFVPVDTEAIRKEDVALAKQLCASGEFFCVASTDGDSDRPLLSDENGVWLKGDSLGILAGRALGVEAVAIPVSCNTAAEKSGFFKEVLRTRIGSPFVIEGIKKLQGKYKSVAGFEANGGFLTESLTTRDALTPIIATIIESKKHNLKISELLAKLPARYAGSGLTRGFSVDSTDGYRIEFENGDIIHLRKSGNAPEFRCYTESKTPEQAELLSDKCIKTFELWKIMGSKLYDELKELTKKEIKHIEENISPMNFEMLRDNPKYDEFEKKGKEILKQGKAAAYLIAGGQGSRLGFEGPKGVFRLESLGKSIFQIHAENMLKLGKNIPWVIMTSPLNNKDTIEHFEQNDYFGLDKNKIKFIEQGTIFAMSPNRELIFENNGDLFLAPDGNGGCFRALCETGALKWLEEQDIEIVFLYGVDNILAKPCDPPFIGAFLDSKMAAASKVVKKKYPEEKMGVFAFKNGLPGVIEYSEISPELAKKLDGGNILAHLFTMESLKKLEKESLPWHLAVKRVCGIEKAFKFEQLLFDAFPKLGNMYLTGVLREEEFAPIKNASGDDSPESAVEMFRKAGR